MCLAIPGKVLKKVNSKEAEVLMGKVKKLIRIDLFPEIKEGDYVLIHAGYAITIIDPEEANEINQLWEEMRS
ncbi:MAG: HypC/HybG/HupF family hydrogenase formation chaperone [Atribacterota bacterium]